MNKILSYIKDFLLLILILLMCLFIKNTGFTNIRTLLYFIILFIFLILSIKDQIQNNTYSSRYYLLSIAVMCLNLLILGRTLFDSNLLCNSKEHMDLIQRYFVHDHLMMNVDYSAIRISYFLQNAIYLFLLFCSLIGYRMIENGILDKMHKSESKYSKSSIICLVMNLVFFLKSLTLLQLHIKEGNFPLIFLICNLILLVIEIWSLLKYNHQKREWPIYLCFVFHLFAFIVIFT